MSRDPQASRWNAEGDLSLSEAFFLEVFIPHLQPMWFSGLIPLGLPRRRTSFLVASHVDQHDSWGLLQTSPSQILHLGPNSLWGLATSMHLICPFGLCILKEEGPMILLWSDCLSLCTEGAGGPLCSRWEHHSNCQAPDLILNSLPCPVPE